MLSLFTKEISDTKHFVEIVHYAPELLTEEEKARAIQVTEIPNPEEVKRGFSAQLYVNPITKELWYEYEERPLTPEERLDQYKTDMDNAIMELTMLIAMSGGTA